MRKITSKFFCLLFVMLIGRAQAQLNGSYTVTIDFPTLASAITSLNAVPPTGPVTINIPAGYTETPVVGGFVLTASGTSLNPIIFKKSGSGVNPLLIAYTGTATPSSTSQDGVFRLIGSDYITIDGIDISDPNSTNPATMEFGYGLFKQNTSNGCQNNIIKNCVITLNRVNNASGSGPAADGSRGIDVVNATSIQHTSSASILSASGANSNNKFYSNVIQNCNICISIFGFSDASPYSNADFLNDIGGISAATTNTFINYGGASSAANPASAVRTANQYSINISNNYIYNNDGSGVNHPNTLRGIYLIGGLESVSTVNNNTIILTSGGTTQQLSPIENASGSGTAGSVTISNNLITNCAYPGATSGPFYGIYNNGSSPTLLSISGNTFTSNSTAATSGFYYNIYNTGNVTGSIGITNNVIGMGTYNAASTSLQMAGVYNNGGATTTTLNISNNTFQNANYSGTTGGSGNVYFVLNGVQQNKVTYSNNNFNNISLKTTGSVYLLHNDNATLNSNISGNNIVTGLAKTLAGNNFYGYYNATSATSGSVNITSNNFSNISLVAGTMFFGVSHNTSITQTLSILNNTISGVNISGTGTGILRGINIVKSAPGSFIANNVLTNYSGTDEITGIYGPNTSGSDNLTIQGNSIGSYTSTGFAGVTGILLQVGNNTSVAQNKLYDLQISNAAGNVIGINLLGGSSTISNNMIGDLRSPIGNSANPVVGININGGSSHNVYYNTVNLNASSSGATFGSSAIYINIAPTVTLRNNIFINNSTPNGTGYSAAYKRSSTALTNYSTASNNNIFYAGYNGAPAPNKVVYYDGVNAYQTLSAFQTAVSPREAGSLTENTAFISTIGSSSNFLHINASLPSLTESGAIAIANYTLDIDNQVRQGATGYSGTGSAPDIGADEYDQSVVACSGATAGVISPSLTSICAGSTSTMTLYSTGYSQAGGITYSWKVSSTPGGPYTNVTSGTGSNTPIFTTASVSAGTTLYYVMVATCSVGTVTNSSNEATLVINPTPTIAASAVNPTLCSGATTTLTASGAGVSGTYTWTTGPTTSTYMVMPITTTTYSVLGTSTAGCNSTLTLITVTVITTPNTAITSNPITAQICVGSSATLTGGSTSATGWSWQPAPSGPLTTSDVVVSPTVTTTYTLTRDVNGNCVDTRTFVLTVNNQPTVGANVSPLQLCAASQATIFGSGAANYSLNTGSAISPFASTIVVSPTITTSYTIMGLSSSGCYSDAVVTLTVLPTPTITTMASPTVICQNDFSILTATGAVSYTWMPGSVANSTAQVMPTLTTNYSVTGVGANGCSTIAVQQVSVRPIPVLNVSTSASLICIGKTATLTASGNGNNYQWNIPPNFPTTQVQTVTPTTSTVYNVLSTFAATGCQTLKSVTVNVFDPSFNSTPSPTTVCRGSTITLSASGAGTYSWSNTNIHTPTLAVSPTITTNYTVSATSVSNNVSCKADNTIQLIVYNLPTVTVLAERNPICQQEPAVMTASGAITYTWTGGAGTSSNASVQLSNTQTFTVTGFDVHNCHSNAVIQISVGICYGVGEIEKNQFNIDLFPNPSTGAFTILSDANIELSIINEVGRIVKNINLADSNGHKIDISDLSSGIYFLVGNSSEGIVKKKIVITR